MGSWKNWQKPAQGENSYQSQVSWISVCSIQQRERENKIFCTLFGDASQVQEVIQTARNIYCFVPAED